MEIISYFHFNTWFTSSLTYKRQDVIQIDKNTTVHITRYMYYINKKEIKDRKSQGKKKIQSILI